MFGRERGSLEKKSRHLTDFVFVQTLSCVTHFQTKNENVTQLKQCHTDWHSANYKYSESTLHRPPPNASITRKLCYRKDDRAMRPTYGCPENFRDSLTIDRLITGHYSQYFHGLLLRTTLWMFLQNLKSVALPVAEIIGVPKKFGQSLDSPRSVFWKNFNGLFLPRNAL